MHNPNVGRLAAVVAIALAACGPSDSQIKTAKEARYKGDKMALFNAARAAVEAKYKLEKAEQDGSGFETIGRWYRHEDGMTVSESKDDIRIVPDKALWLAFQVAFVPDGDSFIVKITPKMMRRISGSPKPEAISENDYSVEGWAHNKIDVLQNDIHEALKQFEVKKTPGAAPTPEPTPTPTPEPTPTPTPPPPG
jgi:hypothetical protein